jgi:uncharacterized protein YbjQ (UPF0145 family)
MNGNFWLETFLLWLLQPVAAAGLCCWATASGAGRSGATTAASVERERALRHVVALNTRYVPVGVEATGARLVSGSVVISSDYFKTFVAGFRAFFGGRFRGYETLLERARREALLRLKAEAQAAGSHAGDRRALREHHDRRLVHALGRGAWPSARR